MKSNKESFDAIIIGSGIGGLVTASQLAAKGAQVLVLEKYIIPGGSGGSFKRKGYTFDVGASMIFGFGEKGYTNLLTRALKDVNEKCETIPDPVQLEYHLPNNFNISVDRKSSKFINKLIKKFPHEIDGIKWSTIFKNSGPTAGASLEHLHSQIVGLDFIPPAIELKMASLVKNPQSFHQLIAHAEKKDCVIARAHDVIAILSPVPRQPFETWILPCEPDPFFSLTASSKADAIATLTRTVIAKIRSVLPQVDYNWWLHQAPFGNHHSVIKTHWHWHLEILPRIAPLAGFELGTGCHINTLSPEDAAQQLKHVPD